MSHVRARYGSSDFVQTVKKNYQTVLDDASTMQSNAAIFCFYAELELCSSGKFLIYSLVPSVALLLQCCHTVVCIMYILTAAIGGVESDPLMRNFFDEYDSNGDGVIGIECFLRSFFQFIFGTCLCKCAHMTI